MTASSSAMDGCDRRFHYPLVTNLFLVLMFNFPLISSDRHTSLVGHLKSLGHHRPPDVVTDELTAVPHPLEFWKQYASKKKPVIFRGAAKHSRAYELWTEEFLILEYGNLMLRLEARSESSNKIPVGETGVLGRDTVRHFLKNYQTVDAYVISQIPQPMERDVSIPPCLRRVVLTASSVKSTLFPGSLPLPLPKWEEEEEETLGTRCGSFNESIQEVHLFLTARGGKTKLHKDPYSNIHCVFNGTKDWILIHPDQTDLVYMSEESAFEWGGYSEIDVDSVDLEMFPKIKDVHYSKVTMNKGDCIFMPGGYWHQVRSKGYMNSAVSIWFSQLRHFSGDGCEMTSVDFTPMDQVPILWRYPGYGDLTQGHMDIHILRQLLLTSADREGKIWLKQFTQKFLKSEHQVKRALLRGDEEDRVKKMIKYLDPDGKGFITQEQVRNFSLTQLKDVLLFIDPTDVSNTEEFEYSHIDADDIRELMKSCQNEKTNFDKGKFLAGYVKILGGTLNKAYEIVMNLGIQDQEVPISDVLKHAPKALHKFYSSRIHDPSFEHKMFKYLRLHDEL